MTKTPGKTPKKRGVKRSKDNDNSLKKADGTETCAYSAKQFRPPCPVTDCPAWTDNVETRCAFIHIGQKPKVTKFDVAQVFGVSEKRVNLALKTGKGELTDAARIIIPALKIEPKGPVIKLKGKFFEKLGVELTKSQLLEISRNRSVNAALKRRMSSDQYNRYVKIPNQERVKKDERAKKNTTYRTSKGRKKRYH